MEGNSDLAMKRFSDLTILFVGYSLLRIFDDTIEESHDALGIGVERIKLGIVQVSVIMKKR